MAEYRDYYVRPAYKKIGGPIETLIQCLRIVFDGDIICKEDRDFYVKVGLIVRVEGYNIISQDGIRCLEKIGIIHC